MRMFRCKLYTRLARILLKIQRVCNNITYWLLNQAEKDAAILEDGCLGFSIASPEHSVCDRDNPCRNGGDGYTFDCINHGGKKYG